MQTHGQRRYHSGDGWCSEVAEYPTYWKIQLHKFHKKWTCPEEAVDYVRTKKGALDLLVGFGIQTDLTSIVMQWTFQVQQNVSNGGTIGLDDLKNYPHAMDVLGGDFEEPVID